MLVAPPFGGLLALPMSSGKGAQEVQLRSENRPPHTNQPNRYSATHAASEKRERTSRSDVNLFPLPLPLSPSCFHHQ